ncbi:MAG: hypothetical protein DRH44_04520 [Candidatus Coatesbacteria bacterium]|nr:MAG: hypothetical protein DRH49_02720 [Candidatus Coatesbacteria bacterium]RLC43662.1 MAG: hypothetical protein DRH44_04520 [Candidatus Coatesbacteria bacterium]
MNEDALINSMTRAILSSLLSEESPEERPIYREEEEGEEELTYIDEEGLTELSGEEFTEGLIEELPPLPAPERTAIPDSQYLCESAIRELINHALDTQRTLCEINRYDLCDEISTIISMLRSMLVRCSSTLRYTPQYTPRYRRRRAGLIPYID